MTRIFAVTIAGAACCGTGCYKVVAPGHVGIVVKQSGSDRGVQDFPIQTGRVWYNPIQRGCADLPDLRAARYLDFIDAGRAAYQ